MNLYSKNKKCYTEPCYDVELFTISDVVSTSSQDDYDEPGLPDGLEY